MSRASRNAMPPMLTTKTCSSVSRGARIAPALLHSSASVHLHAAVGGIVVRPVFVPAEQPSGFVLHGARGAGDTLIGRHSVALADVLDGGVRARGRERCQQDRGLCARRELPGNLSAVHRAAQLLDTRAVAPRSATQNLSTVWSSLSIATGLGRNPATCICAAADLTSVCALSSTTGMS